jgi:hypothetical protein
MRFSPIFAVVALTLGCGRSDLLEDDFSPSGGTGTGGTGGSTLDGGGDLDATSPGHPGHPAADSGVDGATTIGVPDASSGPGSCTPFNCSDGCCQADGTCFRVTPDSNGAIPTNIPCGANGEACVTCNAGYSCLLGCQKDLGTTCTPENCTGCCLAADVNGAMSTQCFEGMQSDFCGTGGGQCQHCAPSGNGGQCVADPAGGGDCVDEGQCNSTNCAGCCSGNLCVVGTQDIGCGSGAVACQDCTADGGVCVGIAPSSGDVRGCGYDCLAGLPVCNTFCPSASNCGPISSFLGSGP